MSEPQGINPHLPPEYAQRLEQIYGSMTEERLERLVLAIYGDGGAPPLELDPVAHKLGLVPGHEPKVQRPTLCECDRFKHERTPCPLPPADHGSVVSSPALCTACLFYCWADE